MDLHTHHRISRIIFWFAQVLGIFMVLALIIFIGGNLLTELIAKLIDVREDYMVFLFFFCELMLAASYVISWKRIRLGAFLVIGFTILICILWGRETITIVYLHLPLLFSGLLLLFLSYYKEWIVKQKP